MKIDYEKAWKAFKDHNTSLLAKAEANEHIIIIATTKTILREMDRLESEHFIK